MRLKTLLAEWLRNMASLDPWWVLSQIDSAATLPCYDIHLGMNSFAPVRRGCPPDLETQMESILEAVSREELRWPLRSDPKTQLEKIE